MLQAYACTVMLGGTGESIIGDDNKEKKLEKEITELKKAQDALSMALERKKADIILAAKNEEMTTCTAIPEIDTEWEELIETVKK